MRIKPKYEITYSFEGYCMILDFKHNGKLLKIFKQGWHDQFVFYKCNAGYCIESTVDRGKSWVCVAIE